MQPTNTRLRLVPGGTPAAEEQRTGDTVDTTGEDMTMDDALSQLHKHTEVMEAAMSEDDLQRQAMLFRRARQIRKNLFVFFEDLES